MFQLLLEVYNSYSAHNCALCVHHTLFQLCNYVTVSSTKCPTDVGVSVVITKADNFICDFAYMN
jgi:hypothetical protein